MNVLNTLLAVVAALFGVPGEPRTPPIKATAPVRVRHGFDVWDLDEVRVEQDEAGNQVITFVANASEL